jgi:aryl-alcohol dehydrogenase-like predicted oxidoreductase
MAARLTWPDDSHGGNDHAIHATGNTGLVVSRLAFGAMTFGTGTIPAIFKVDEDNARAMVDRALAAGINFFDTADAYAEGGDRHDDLEPTGDGVPER